MDSSHEKTPREKLYSLRSLAILAMGFFLLVTLLTALVIVPKINQVFESQFADDTRVSLALEAKLFKNFVEGQKTKLEDLAQFPSLVNAAMLSDASDPALIDLVDNVVIGGETSRLVLQNIAGDVLITSEASLQGSYAEDEPWVNQVVDGSIAYHFQLLSQIDELFSFKLSVPVKYNNFIEGVLTAEITASLNQIFVAKAFDNHVAFKLVQGEATVSTKSSHIEIPFEQSLELEQPDLTFVYITDIAIIKQKERSLRNTILLVLFTGLGISFLLFVVYGYRTQPTDEKMKIGKVALSQNYIIPVVIAAIGTATSLTAFFMIYYSQNEAIEQEKIGYGKEYIHSIKNSIDRNVAVLNSLASFYDASNLVDRQEFETFTKSLIANNPNIQALAWVPNVTSNERLTYEQQAQSDGLNNFEFKEIGENERLRSTSNRDQYFPVYYIAPMQGNEKVFGFDLASHGQRLDALSKAGKTGTMVATAPVELVEQEKTQAGILFFYPVYREGNAAQSSIDDEFGPIKGFVLMVLKADEILNSSLIHENIIVNSYVQDITDSNNQKTFYGDVISPNEVTFSQTIDVASRAWQIDTITKTTDDRMLWTPWLILLSGLIITLLLTSGLVHLIRRRESVEQLVKERTAELRMLNSVVANANDIFTVISADEHTLGNGGRKILYVNDAFTRSTGYSCEETIGTETNLLHGPKTDLNQIASIRTAIAEGQSYQGELIRYTKDNEEFWADVNMFPLTDDTGKIIQYASVQRDITDRKRAQEELEHLIDKLTDSNEELARFAFVCSHDLQEPLRMIRSFSEKLQVHIANDLANDEKGQRYFRFIIEGATRAQALIQDILAYSSIDSDTQQLKIIEGNHLIDNIRDAMQVSLQSSGAMISSDELPELQGNRTQLFQLFQNIINNAIKYKKPDTAPVVHISVSDAGNHWRFAISDNGIGMEQRHLNKIFDVFQRLHRTSQYAGTGIGLSICKKVVERHGGTLWVESELNVGTTFYFTLLKPVDKEITNEEQRKAS